jgi:hypothetical protein
MGLGRKASDVLGFSLRAMVGAPEGSRSPIRRMISRGYGADGRNLCCVEQVSPLHSPQDRRVAQLHRGQSRRLLKTSGAITGLIEIAFNLI